MARRQRRPRRERTARAPKDKWWEKDKVEILAEMHLHPKAPSKGKPSAYAVYASEDHLHKAPRQRDRGAK